MFSYLVFNWSVQSMPDLFLFCFERQITIQSPLPAPDSINGVASLRAASFVESTEEIVRK